MKEFLSTFLSQLLYAVNTLVEALRQMIDTILGLLQSL